MPPVSRLPARERSAPAPTDREIGKTARMDLRIERFSSPAYRTHLRAGDSPPATGWAIRDDGDVFCDGVQVGRSGKYVFDRATGSPYLEITFEGIDTGP